MALCHVGSLASVCQVVVGKAWRVCQMVVVCQGDGEGMAGLGTDAAPAAAHAAIDRCIEGMVTADILADDNEYREVSGWGVHWLTGAVMGG